MMVPPTILTSIGALNAAGPMGSAPALTTRRIRKLGCMGSERRSFCGGADYWVLPRVSSREPASAPDPPNGGSERRKTEMTPFARNVAGMAVAATLAATRPSLR